MKVSVEKKKKQAKRCNNAHGIIIKYFKRVTLMPADIIIRDFISDYCVRRSLLGRMRLER